MPMLKYTLWLVQQEDRERFMTVLLITCLFNLIYEECLYRRRAYVRGRLHCIERGLHTNSCPYQHGGLFGVGEAGIVY